jgi:hypothetical protein
MKSARCLSIYPSMSLHFSVYNFSYKAYEITLLTVRARECTPNFSYKAYEITLLSVCPNFFALRTARIVSRRLMRTPCSLCLCVCVSP